jgi:hypothetical protein
VATRLLVCVCGLLALLFAETAWGEGKYQRTKDGETIVWNEIPKPGDTATWSGSRDTDGYATKVGTLTWYTAKGTVYARFVGNMVHGRFDGPVNGYSRRKTAHAIFSHGQRTTRWAAGTAPSIRSAPTEPVRPKQEVAKSSSSQTTKHSSSTSTDPQAAEPVERKMVRSLPARERPGFEKISPPTPETFRQQTATPPPQDVAETKATDKSPLTNNVDSSADDLKQDAPDAPAEGPQTVATAPSSDTPPAPSTAESPARNAEDIHDEETKFPTESSSATPAENVAPDLPSNGEKKNDVDVAVPTLMQPVTTSHEMPGRAAPSEVRPRLTAEEVIRIANAEARRRGYNWAEYQKEEPVLNADHRTWSVRYQQTTPDGIVSASKRFNVIVDDKTRGAIVVPRE